MPDDSTSTTSASSVIIPVDLKGNTITDDKCRAYLAGALHHGYVWCASLGASSLFEEFGTTIPDRLAIADSAISATGAEFNADDAHAQRRASSSQYSQRLRIEPSSPTARATSRASRSPQCEWGAL